jgi:hypothetical protein
MISKGKQDAFTISDKINIAVQVHAHIGTNIELASHLSISVSKLNTNVKN